MKQDKIKRLVNHLLALADRDRGGTDGECAVASIRLTELILKYNLKISFPDGQTVRQGGEPEGNQRPKPKDAPKKRPPYIIIMTKYDSWCRQCGAALDKGQRCAWKRGYQVTCVGCAGSADWTTPREPPRESHEQKTEWCPDCGMPTFVCGCTIRNRSTG